MAAENNVPKVVREEADAVEKAILEARKQEQAPEPEPEKTEAEEAPAPESVAETAEPEPAPEPEAKPQDESVAELARLKQSLAVLQGKYNAEVPKLHAHLRERDERIHALEAEAERLRAEAKTAPKEDDVDPKNPYGLTSEELELGPEPLSVAEKVAKAMLKKQEQEIQRLKDELQAVSKSTSEERTSERFWNTLETAVPDWSDINSNPDFQTWLMQVDPLSGAIRDELLKSAQRSSDGQKAANVFLAWKAARPADAPKTTKRPSVASQVTPASAPAKPVVAPAKKTYTLAEYEEQMTRLTKGEFTPTRAREVRAELDQALRDGRVK